MEDGEVDGSGVEGVGGAESGASEQVEDEELGNSQKIIYQFIGPEVEQLRYREVIRQCPNCR